MAEGLEEIKKLSPEERIRRLRELEVKRKKESVESQEIIKESVAQIKREDQLQEQIRLPEQKEVDITKLFEEEGGLEATVEKEKKELSVEELAAHQHYQVELSQEPTEQLYQRIKSMYQQIKQGRMGYPERDNLNDLSYALDYKTKDIESGTYRPVSDQVEDLVSASKSLVNYMRKGK